MTSRQKEKVVLKIEIDFPNSSKKVKEKEEFFSKFLSLIEEDSKSLPIEITPNKKRKTIILDSEEFLFLVIFGKKGQTVGLKVSINNPEINLEMTNIVGNKVINYLNIILSDGAINPNIFSTQNTYYPGTILNLSEKIIGETKIAKINEKLKQNIKPIGVFFEYSDNDRKNAIMSVSDGNAGEGIISQITYKGKLPFDFVQKECEVLTTPRGILKRLAEMEL